MVLGLYLDKSKAGRSDILIGSSAAAAAGWDISSSSTWPYAARERSYLVSGTKNTDSTRTTAARPPPKLITMIAISVQSKAYVPARETHIYQLPGPIFPAMGDAKMMYTALMIVCMADCHIRKVERSWRKWIS